VRTIQVRIVGAITDSNQLEDLQDIAKIFVYEQRMKTTITHPTQPIIAPTPPKPFFHTINNYCPTIPQTRLHHIRGFA
jgi:hypothetical protein